MAGDSATFHGTPPETGVWTLWLTADDGRGGAVSTTFILTVSGDNLPPYLQILIPDQVASAGSPFTVACTESSSMSSEKVTETLLS